MERFSVRYSFSNSLKLSATILVLTIVGLTPILTNPPKKRGSAASQPAGTVSDIYSPDPNDSWNRIFACLFTRKVKVHLSAEFKEGAPFTRAQYGLFPHDLSISTRLFERVETGDQAIEPLYPSFFSSVGVSQVLSDPLYSQLRQALTDALEESQDRPAVARALMQSDAWAAYDLLFRNSHFTTADRRQLLERRTQLLALLARFIKRLALTQSEIENLPDNYLSASGSYKLPRLFDPSSGWLEVQWHAGRLHDESADHRRSARIFIKPMSPPQDKQEFLNNLRNAPDVSSKLEAVALVIQDLLIERNGNVVPSRLTYDVQIRRFIKNERGILITTEVEEYELSRRRLLITSVSGGLVSLKEKAPAYLPSAGNDYGFASIQNNQRGDNLPVLTTLRSRCVACHAERVAVVFTFGTTDPTPFSPISQLNPLSNEHALYVAQRKMARDDFRALSEQK